MRYYTGPHPCPGCGTPGTECSRISKDSICHNCSDLIKLGKGVRKHMEGFSSISLAQYKFARTQLIKFNSQRDTEHSDIPHYVSDSDYGLGKSHSGSSREIRDEMFAFLETIDEGVKPKTEFSVWMEDSPYNETFYVRTPVAKAFFKLCCALAKFSRRIYKEGFDDGKNLLVGLNKGSLSLKDFEERTNRDRS